MSDQPLSEAAAIRIAGRVVAVYFFYCVIADAIALPREFFATVSAHRLDVLTGSALLAARNHDYFWNEVGFLAGNLLRMLCWLVAGLWFYRCGPAAQSLLGQSQSRHEEIAIPVVQQ